MGSSDNHKQLLGWRLVLIVFLLALAVRLIVFSLALNQNTSDQLTSVAPDVKMYLGAATHLLETGDLHSPGVNIFGPGYPLWLSLWHLLTGGSPALMLLAQVILSSLGAALMTVFAYELLGERWVALGAGMLNALSMTSVALANILLSDTLFFTLEIAGLLCFLIGLKRYQWRYQILSGLLLGSAAMVRSLGLYIPVVLIVWLVALTIGRRDTDDSFTVRRLWPAVIPTVCIVVLMGSWAMRHRLPEESQMPLAGPGGLAKIGHIICVEVNGSDYRTELIKFEAEVDSIAALDVDSHEPAFVRHSVARFVELARTYPSVTATRLRDNIRDNTNNAHSLMPSALPEWKDDLTAFNRWIIGNHLEYRATVLSLVGLIIMLLRRKYRAATCLVVLYGYFAVEMSLTIWQGDRVFYPGQIAWAVLCAYPLSLIGVWRQRRVIATSTDA